MCARMFGAFPSYRDAAIASPSGGAFAVGIAHHRADRATSQPLYGGDGRFLAAADIRLDNREALGEALGISGPDLHRMSDPGLLLLAWERWGDGAPDRLVGDFAFALWDAKVRRLHLVRSTGGMRPLHYHDGGDFVAFASMPNALHRLDEVPYALDERRLVAELILSKASDDSSCFQGISRVQPARMVVLSTAPTFVRRYWYPEKVAPLKLRDSAQYEERLRELFDQAVGARLRDTDAVASQLSGGRDSSSVTATAAMLLAPRGGRVHAFTAAPREGYQGYHSPSRFADETDHARAVAILHGNIDHRILRSGTATPVDELDRAFDAYQQPVADLANMAWVHRSFAEARKCGQRRMLVGNFGNFTISYSGEFLLSALFRSGRWGKLWREGRALIDAGMSRNLVIGRTLGPWIPQHAWKAILRKQYAGPVGVEAFAAINPHYLARLRSIDPSFGRESVASTPGSRQQLFQPLIDADAGNLYKGAEAGWGIEICDPTSDRRLAEFCLSVPDEIYLQNGMRSALLRKAFADRLPPIVLDEERRGYQSADWHETLTRGRTALRAELDRLQSCAPARRILDLDRMRALIERWPTAGWHDPAVMMAYRTCLMRGILIGHFIRRTCAGDAP